MFKQHMNIHVNTDVIIELNLYLFQCLLLRSIFLLFKDGRIRFCPSLSIDRRNEHLHIEIESLRHLRNGSRLLRGIRRCHPRVGGGERAERRTGEYGWLSPPSLRLLLFVCGGIMRKKGRVHLKIPESSRRRAAHGDPSMPRNAGF